MAPAPGSSDKRSPLLAVAAFLPALAFPLLVTTKQIALVDALNLQRGHLLAEMLVASSLLATVLIATLRANWQLPGFVLADAVLSVIGLIDRAYFRAYGDIPSAVRLHDWRELIQIRGAAFGFFHADDLWIFADVVFLLLLWLAGRNELRPARLPFRWGAAASAVTVGALLVLFRIDVVEQDPMARARSRFRLIGPAMHHVLDAVAALDLSLFRSPPSTAEKAAFQVELQRLSQKRPRPGELFGAARGVNVIILQIESLQAYPFGLKVDGEETLPNLQRLAGESISFSEAYTVAGPGSTADSDFAVNCSQYPMENEVVYTTYSDRTMYCLPGALRDRGYHTTALNGADADFWNVSTIYPRIGFDQFLSKRDFDARSSTLLGILDAKFLPQAVARIAALPEPSYAFAMTVSSHMPFDDYRRGPTGAPRATELERYLAALRDTDRAVGTFVEGLRTRGLLDRSVLVVYGDHGVQDMKHDQDVGRALGLDPANEAEWIREHRHVPLMIRLPHGTQASVRRDVVSLVDVAPTILGLLGVQDVPVWMGRDLLRSWPHRDALFADGSAIDEKSMFLAGASDPKAACFDREKRRFAREDQCRSLREDVAGRLEFSRHMIRRDLVAAGVALPASPAAAVR